MSTTSTCIDNRFALCSLASRPTSDLEVLEKNDERDDCCNRHRHINTHENVDQPVGAYERERTKENDDVTHQQTLIMMRQCLPTVYGILIQCAIPLKRY